MKNSVKRVLALALSLVLTLGLLAGCGNSGTTPGGESAGTTVDPASLAFPLAEKAELNGLTNFPVGSESEPNNRTIFKRLEEQTNVHINWKAIQGDQWGEKIALEMSNVKTLPDFVFNAGFGDTDLLKYAKQGVIINVEEYIDKYMPNLSKVFADYPEYRAMCEDENGHIWALPWIEQLGANKTAIQAVGNMSFINVAWLNFLGLEKPETVEEFEAVLIAFRDNAEALQAEFGIEGSVIPMSCILNDGDQDPYILINGFGEGYGDPDRGRHINVTNDKKVVCSATAEGFKKGTEWLHNLYAQGLIDAEAFTQDWSTYVAKGKSGRYGVCFSWDVANIANLTDWEPLPALTADVTNLTAQNGSFTSGFDRGRCVVTAAAKNPALVCAWLDQMYAPIQAPQNNWGTYGEDEQFPVVGGASAYHAAQIEKDENYMMPSAPGKFALTETDELTFKMLVPETEHSKLTEAATMVHMMNGNNFSCGAYRLAAADVDAFVTAMKAAVTGNRWMCGMPETLLIATIGGEYVVVVWGVGDAMNPFETKFVAAYPTAKLVVDEALVG